MSDAKYQMTRETLESLEAELHQLETEERAAIAERIRIAREWGDLKENAEYHDAKKSQAMLETRILQLRETALNAEVREVEAAGSGVAGLGSRVTVVDEERGRESVYTLVPATEADAATGKVSFQSPVGRALDGARPGDVVTVPTPKGERRLTVRAIA